MRAICGAWVAVLATLIAIACEREGKRESTHQARTRAENAPQEAQGEHESQGVSLTEKAHEEETRAETTSVEAKRATAETANERMAFDPARDGFAFVNSFSGSPLPAGLTRMVETLGIGAPTSGYGLCGGMSAAAADFYLAGLKMPRRKDVPREGDPLFTYLTLRQGDSIGPGIAGAMKFAEWMALRKGGSGGLLVRTGHELSTLREKLQERGVQPIGLIYRRSGEGGVWDNHQVLAYRVVDVAPGRVDVMLYDPNAPGDGANRLEMTAVGEGTSTGYSTVQRFTRGGRSRMVHGWFVVTYEPKAPPAGV